MLILLQFLFLIYVASADDFAPTTSDYDAYGLKIAGNSLMIVEAQNDLTQFLIQFSPYSDNTTQTSARSCLIEYDDLDQFVYSVALGKNQSIYNIFFVGEMLGTGANNPIGNRTFVGVLNYIGCLTTIDCVKGFTISTQYVSTALAHQEHLVMTTDPFGLIAYGFSDFFTFSYTASTNTLVVHANNSLSPSKSFLPFAVDYDGSYGIISGFLVNGRNSLIKYIATVFLFNVNVGTAIATPISSWQYTTNSSTWQAAQTNAGADQYAAKFDMSVSIAPTATQALVGIQSMNTVFLFSYTATALTFVTSIGNGQGIGFGKGVAWFSYAPNSFAILVNVYSTTYVWSSSKIYMYEGGLTNTSIPVSIFPNIKQQLYSYMYSVFLNIITTPDNLVLLDNQGGLFVILQASSSYYSSTTGPSIQIVPAFSTALSCIPGTYKRGTGLGRCLPCPTGTKNDGTNLTATACINCATNTSCPFGSTSDAITIDMLSNVTQAVAYPQSPDITRIDDILFLTLFSNGSTSRCVALSPIFWTLIVAALVIIIGIGMLVLKYCLNHPKAESTYERLENVFKRTDIITGEMWIGGLASFCIIVLCISCITFSAQYYNSYPIETDPPSTYTCDITLRNAQFSSVLRGLSVPVSDDIQSMFDALNSQTFELDVAFMNTAYNCTSNAVTLSYLSGSTWVSISSLSCNKSNYILSYSAILPFRPITVQFTLSNIYTIGGLRIGLSGPGQNLNSTKTLQTLSFSQVFIQDGRMVGQNVNIALELTKVINDTSPLISGGDDVYSALWIGEYSVNYYTSFMADTDYLNAVPQTATNITLVITETDYYIYNSQSPICRLPMLIYHDFLFITMAIGMFALMFLIFKLMIIPFVEFVIDKCKLKFNKSNQVSDNKLANFANDSENPTSNSNDQNGSKHEERDSIANHFSPVPSQTTIINENANHDTDNNYQPPKSANATKKQSVEPVLVVQVRTDGNRIIKEKIKQ